MKLVTSPDHMRIWNELMIGGHPQGAGVLVGRQFFEVLLGGLATDRPRQLDQLGCRTASAFAFGGGNEPFSDSPQLQCGNLASKVMGTRLAALPADFERHYGYRPYLVECFVDTQHLCGNY
jgi:hypothetical protein